MESVIQEFRVIETEDGFRIEVKGDKEAFRRMWNGCRAGDLFGCGSHWPDFWRQMNRWCDAWWETREDKESV